MKTELQLFRCSRCGAIFGKTGNEIEDPFCNGCRKYTKPVIVMPCGDGSTMLLIEEDQS